MRRTQFVFFRSAGLRLALDLREFAAVLPAERAGGAPSIYRKAPTRRAAAHLRVVHEAPADMPAIATAAGRGDWARAAALADALLRRDPGHAGARYLRALVLLNTGRPGGAARERRRTAYRDRDLALAHYQLGLARRDAGDLRAAARSFRTVIGALGAADDERPAWSGDELRCADLRALAAEELARLERR